MFLENEYAQPLFDLSNGGSPRAYRCKIEDCQKVVRTERGMRMHLRSVHNIMEQPCLFSTDNPNPISVGSAQYRKQLRVSQKPNAIRENMDSLNSPQKFPATKEGE